VIGIGTQPTFAISQRAIIIATPNGNILWDCLSLLAAATIILFKGLGSQQAIAISHPHVYIAMIACSQAFGGVPVHLQAADQKWIMRCDPCVQLWHGDILSPLPGVTPIRCGGYFAGSCVLHSNGANGANGGLCALWLSPR
jgi:hypothetical protein